jgi:hypothetical protein
MRETHVQQPALCQRMSKEGVSWGADTRNFHNLAFLLLVILWKLIRR